MRMGIDTKLKQAIRERGLRQDWIAQQIGLHESELSRIVRGRLIPTDDQKKAIARVLRAKVTDLFSEAAA